VDRAAGVIRGVKLLGLSSRNGRRYRAGALVEAVGLYEGAKVNINHPKGHPLSPRDYQDRLGVVRGVVFRDGEGLFGDLHFNPKHTLSEQLVWDAEHAPQNVGMSHNVLARTSKSGDETVVETITKVQSIDLVADPATTSGLYEHAEGRGLRGEGHEPEGEVGKPSVEALTLEQLRVQRPDLIAELELAHTAQLQEIRAQLDELTARVEASRRRDRVLQLLQEHNLPIPTTRGSAESHLVSPQFVESLMGAADDATLERLIEERAALVRSASEWGGGRSSNHHRPRSRHQLEFPFMQNGQPVRSAAEFAAAIRGR
jgi:hypothetical protein